MLLKARADMDIGETDLDLTATVSHNVRDASVSIPPAKDGPPPGGSTQPQDQDLKIAVSPGSQPINGSITIHLIPSLNFGVSAVIGQINTGLFVDFDSSTTFLLTPPATPPPPPAPGAVEKGYSGCVQILGGMVSTAGAVAKFFTFLDDKVTVPLFEKRFQMLSVRPPPFFTLKWVLMGRVEMLRGRERGRGQGAPAGPAPGAGEADC